jgi:hypothetical protein
MFSLISEILIKNELICQELTNFALIMTRHEYFLTRVRDVITLRVRLMNIPNQMELSSNYSYSEYREKGLNA